MKISIPVQKPRATSLNALLRSKRCERHADPRKLSRNQEKSAFRKMLQSI